MVAHGIPHYAGAGQLSLAAGWRLAGATCALIAALGVPQASAETVYRWVDEHGRTHFGSHPGAADARRLDIQTAPQAPTEDAALSRRQENQRRLLDDFSRERELRRAEDAEREARRLEQAALCAELQRQRDQLLEQGPVYLIAPDGSRDYLDESRRAAALQRLAPEIRAACGALP